MYNLFHRVQKTSKEKSEKVSIRDEIANSKWHIGIYCTFFHGKIEKSHLAIKKKLILSVSTSKNVCTFVSE